MINLDLIQKAISLTQDGKIEEAQIIYDELLKQDSNDVNLLSVYGLFCVNIGNIDKACEVLHRACDIKETFGNLSALGFAEYERLNYDEAIIYFEKALTFGENIDIYDKLVSCFFETKKYSKAIEIAAKMYSIFPKEVKAIACKIKALTQEGKLLEAEKLCVESIKENMNSASLWFHLGFLKELIYCNDLQAKECYKLAAERGNADANYNLAVSCQKLGEFAEAESHYKAFIELHPNNKRAISAYGMCKLSQKKFKEGYELYFNRNKFNYEKLSSNFWQPHQELDEEINIICDQGYGDSIQFIRYIPFLNSKKINIATRTPLINLFKYNFPNLNYVDYEKLNPNIQTIFLSDIAFILNIDFDNIPYSKGYLEIDKSTKLNLDTQKLKIGLCWEAGNTGLRTMINKTINIKFFEDLINLKDVQVYSFQVDDSLNGNNKYSQMINLAKDFKNFYDTAIALQEMDIVITVDTAIVHLAGSMGIKTYLLLPYTSDWRWFGDTKRTPWYDSIEIFKQDDNISWQHPIAEIMTKLQNI